MERLGVVQFSDALDPGGSAVHQIGSAKRAARQPGELQGLRAFGMGLAGQGLLAAAGECRSIFDRWNASNPDPDPRGRRSGRSDRAERGNLHVLVAWLVANDYTILAASSDAGSAPSAALEPAAVAYQPEPEPAPVPTAPAAFDSQGTSISVVTWNVQVNDSSAAHARAVMATIAAMSPQPQVVVIEEAHRSQYGTYIDELQERTGRAWSGDMLTHCAPGAWTAAPATARRMRASRYSLPFRSSIPAPGGCRTPTRGILLAPLFASPSM